MLRRLASGFVLAALALACAPAWANCQLDNVAALPVTMLGMRALLPAKINGQDVQFVVDSGAFYSTISTADADKFKLPRRQMPFGANYISGVGGDAYAEVGTVDVLTLANTPLKRIEFVVAGGEVGEGSVGLLGENILGRWDVEYDLAKGSVHIWEPKGCGRSDMSYWTKTAPDQIVDLDSDHRSYVMNIKGPVYVNGVRLTAMFDTGASASFLTRRGAARAGIKSSDPGVAFAGYSSGIGRRAVKNWTVLVKSFKIDQEEIRNTKMRFGDFDIDDVDMLVGMDFFLAHHIFVSNSQHKMYLTYNGGPVFDLSQTPTLMIADAPGAPPTPAPPGAVTDPSQANPTDAAGFARRGAGFAARNEFGPAIADLSKAIDMAPTVADYPYQRGLIYLRNKQPFLAMADFDQTLKLKPDDVPALIARAALRLAGHETAQAVQDLEAADKASAKQDDVHFQIAELYERADLPPAAIDQFSLWIDAHSEDARLPGALNGRCWLRALTGVDLDKALNDCNRAIRTAPKNASMFDSRGLVRLRLGDLDQAIADYDASLAINPKLGWSLYGRGLAKTRKGMTADGAADIAAAVAINPKLADEAKKRGLLQVGGGGAADHVTAN